MAHALPDGTIFADRYRIIRCMAAGGMGAVYEVLHLETERRRALKVMLPHVLASPELRERFKREAKIAAGIESEHIIEVFDAGLDDATEMPFIVMELLKGEDLGKRLKRVGRFPQAEVLTYLHQTALALDDTHRASIVHRDLKPENLFLTERRDGWPRIKVLDFGIAKLVADSTSAGPTQALGTPLYMAPEQFRMTEQISPATDIHALGMIAYTLLVGVTYWREEARANVFAFAGVAVLGTQEPATQRAARAGVTLPPTFDGWFAKATALEPQRRFQSASAAVRALELALAGAPVTLVTPATQDAQDVQDASLDGAKAPMMPSAPAPMMSRAPPEGAALTPLPGLVTSDISLTTVTVTGDAALLRPSISASPRRRGVVVVAGVAALAVGGLGWWLGGGTAPVSSGAGNALASSASAAPPVAPASSASAAPPEQSAAPPSSASPDASTSAKVPARPPRGRSGPAAPAAPARAPPAKAAPSDDDIYKRH